MPKYPQTYIHRIGRTGRADKTGIALSFITKLNLPMQKEIETLMKKKIELLKIPEAVEISENLTQDEKPVTRDKSLKKAPKHITPTGAFHEKKDKNKKVNNKIRLKEKMHAKYGKPKTRGQKPKKKK